MTVGASNGMPADPTDRGGPLSYSEDNLLPISAVADFAYCPRRAALHQIERVWQDNVATAEGHNLHAHVHAGGAESRRTLRIARGLRIRSLRLGLAGIADVVEFRRMQDASSGARLPGTASYWRPFPVEYKRGILRRQESFRIQLCAQALCLEEMLRTKVPEGALFYGKSRRRLAVVFDAALRAQCATAAKGLHDLIRSGVTPAPVHDKRCKACSVADLCMPKLTGTTGAVARYMGSIEP